MQSKKGFHFWSVTVLLIAWVVLILAISFFYFFAAIDGHTEEHAKTSLRDVSKGITELLEKKIQGQWETLAPVTKYAGDVEDLLHSDTLIQIMESMKVTSNFSVVFVADRTGNSVNDQSVMVSVADRYYFKKAMQGYRSVSRVLRSRTTDEDVFVFSAPVYNRFGVVGALGATIRIQDFQQLVDLSIFEGKGYAYLLTANGTILVEPAADSHLVDSNVFEFLSRADAKSSMDADLLRKEMTLRQQGYLSFVANGEVQNAYYMPIGINDWYILCGVPADYLKGQSSELSWIALKLCLGILAALAPIVLVVLMDEKRRKADLLERNKELQWNEERFRIASSLSNSIIFEADLQKGTIIFPNGFKRLMGYEPVTEGFPASLIEAGHVHPDDGEAFLDMHSNLPPNTEKLSGEFRLLADGGDYVWHRIEEVLLWDEKERAVRSIGRALNIHEEKKAIELLEAKTQIDSGSGLYNKHATELIIRQCLEDNPQGAHAMVVIDIDGFKSINDSRGHHQGDKVIADLANLLKSQFRSTDILGRIGGDEFMLLLKDIPNELFVAVKTAKIRKTLQAMHQVGISAGIAIYPKDGVNYLDLYKHADMAMYSVKKNGKNGFAFYVDVAKGTKTFSE